LLRDAAIAARLTRFRDGEGGRVGVAEEQAVGGKADALAVVGEQRRKQRAARRVPELDHIVVATGDDPGAVGRERDRPVCPSK
jgi:hypothetical protein